MTAQDCLEHCLAVLSRLLAAYPQYFLGATLIVDSKGVYAPAGKANGKGERLAAVALKVCTLSVVVEGEAVPLVWLFAPQDEAEVTLGKQLLERALPLLAPAGVATLLLDAGYLDGAWLADLHRRWGLRVGVRIRADLRLHAAAFGELEGQEQRRPQPPSPWQEAPAPTRKGKPRPRRQVALVRNLEHWESAGGPVDVLALRDTYPDGSVEVWAVAFFGNTEEDSLLLLEEWRQRWAIEEFFMVADRYRKLGRLFPCREGFARAWVHFAFLAHLLLWCFDHDQPKEPLPEPKAGGLLVIRGPYYAIVSVGRLLQIVLDHHEAWQSKRAQVFARLGLNDPSP